MTRELRRTAHRCPECDSPVIAPVVLVEAAQSVAPIEKPQGYFCAAHCGWETFDIHFFD